jgi:hypothetical protein
MALPHDGYVIMKSFSRKAVDVTGTVAHRIAQMTPDERAKDALDLAERVRRRLAEYRMTIEHEPKE